MDIQDIIEQGLVVCGQDPENTSHYFYFANSIGMKVNAVSAELNDLPDGDQNIHLIPKIKEWFSKEPIAWFFQENRQAFFSALEGCLIAAPNNHLTEPVKEIFNASQLRAIFEFACDNCQAYIADGCAVAISKRGDMAMCLALAPPKKKIIIKQTPSGNNWLYDEFNKHSDVLHSVLRYRGNSTGTETTKHLGDLLTFDDIKNMGQENE